VKDKSMKITLKEVSGKETVVRKTQY